MYEIDENNKYKKGWSNCQAQLAGLVLFSVNPAMCLVGPNLDEDLNVMANGGQSHYFGK
jgi:hypothetical protein